MKKVREAWQQVQESSSPRSSCSGHIAPGIPSLAVVAVTRMTLEGPTVAQFLRLQLFFSSIILETTNSSYGMSSS